MPAEIIFFFGLNHHFIFRRYVIVTETAHIRRPRSGYIFFFQTEER